MTASITSKVRPATLRDAKPIAELHNLSLQQAFLTSATQAALPVVPQERRQAFWREAIEFSEPQVLVAQDEDGIIGFVGFDRSRDPGTPPTMGEIWALYVRPTHWSRGVGLALWDAAREGLVDEGCSHVSMWVPLACERALRFAELAGLKREMTTARTSTAGATRFEEIRLKRPL